MVVRAGREFLAIPGPTTVPDEVLRAMHRPAVDIYGGPLLALTDSLLADISRLFRTEGRSYIYIANGHGAWEAALTNVLSKGDKVLVLESGRFAVGWGNAAAFLGAEVEALKGEWDRAVRPAEVEARLKEDKARKVKSILVAHIDTSSGWSTTSRASARPSALPAVRRAVTVWAKGRAFDFNISAPSERSDTVTTILMADGRDPGPLRDYCNAKCGVVLGAGIGELAGKAFRIAHMGHVNAPMVLGTLGVVEMGLKALGIPHCSEGVQAAIDWLGKSVKP